MSERSKARRSKGARKVSRVKTLLGALLGAGIALVLASLLRPQASVDLPHVHGIGFSPDGDELYVAAHEGLRVYADGDWSVPGVPKHDYMGFTAVDDGFYSSGHPELGSGLGNPLGLVRSVDNGETLQQLAFSGESDFHLMGVGFHNHAIYVINTVPNSEMEAGLYYSLDDGKTWQPPATTGMMSLPFALAVHPTEANIVALATSDGLMLSSDHGKSYTLVGKPEHVRAVAFHPHGDRVLFGNHALFTYELATRAVTEVPGPELAPDDPLCYIAVDGAGDRIALATFNRDIYLSEDGGNNWVQIAENGKGT